MRRVFNIRDFNNTMNRRVIIPAAGKGSRLGGAADDLPKAMRACGGKPLLETVLESTAFISPEDTYIVVGYKKEDIIEYFGDRYNYVEQTEQLGTGHAVLMCREQFDDFEGTVLVDYGDMPLFRYEDMKRMCELLENNKSDCIVMTAENPDLKLWARIIRDENGNFQRIVEGKDCNPVQARITELYAGITVYNSKNLFNVLEEIRPNNVQHEYYLTEVPEIMARKGMKVETYHIEDGDDLRGVNTLEDLDICERILRERNWCKKR